MNSTLDLIQSEEIFHLLKTGKFDFIDAGCGTGGSINYCKKVFDKLSGIGFDKDLKKIKVARNNKFEVFYHSITEINFPNKCVTFSSMLDFLEHLPDLETAEKVLFNLGSASSDFLFIRHPSFEAIDYLKKLDLKITWTDWCGHKNMMRISDFIYIFNKFGWHDYRIIPRKLIENSEHSAILPIDYPPNSNRFEKGKCFDKPSIIFDQPLFEQYDIFVKLDKDMIIEEWDRITSATSFSAK